MAVNKRQYSETIDHLLIKNFLTDNIPLENDVKKIDQEIKIGNRIADIYIELTNGRRIVIEIQHSRISKADLIQRTKEYNEQGAHVLWILDGTGPYDRKPQNEPQVHISGTEKELQLLNKGSVYYINASAEGIQSPVYALHFTPFIQKKTSMFGAEYYTQLKVKKSVVYSDISSLKLSLFQHKWLKLAKFSNMDAKTKCTNDVRRFLNGFIAYREQKPKEAKKTFPNGIHLGILIKKFQEKYGLFLLFDVLRKLKLLAIRDAHYMFEEKLWFKKCILS